MSDVFLIGAGFSRAISQSMPLLDGLTKELLGRMMALKGLQDLKGFPIKLGDNVELWLTYLSQPHPWLGEPQNLRNRAAFLEFGQYIRDILDEQTRAALQHKCPDWLNTLVNWWHNNKSNVITLNYDTLIERAAGLINVGGNSSVSIQDIYPVALTEARRRDATIWGSDHIESFNVFKLHGSVNWYYSGASSYVGETIYYSDVVSWGDVSSNNYEAQSVAAASDKVPLIVPPTTEKAAYFQHETIRRTWALAGEALREATRLVCIGYSLPQTDLSIQFFLKDARVSGAIPLTIVNSEPHIAEHYRKVLGDTYVIDTPFGGEDAVKNFVAQPTEPRG